MSKRINPNEVKGAYERTNLKPVFKGTLTPHIDCGCPLAAMFFDFYKVVNVPNVATELNLAGNDIYAKQMRDMIINWSYEHYGEDYTNGFIFAIDNPNGKSVVQEENWQRGLEDGKAVRDLIFN